jgi:hypothetical protein
MLSQFLLPETVARQDGVGAEVECHSKVLHLTLGITRTIAQENLQVSVWGSADCQHWRHLAAFPQKFYCGVYSLALDLNTHSDVRYLRAQWKMERWAPGSAHDERAPMFEFYLRVESGRQKRGAGAA